MLTFVFRSTSAPVATRAVWVIPGHDYGVAFDRIGPAAGGYRIEQVDPRGVRGIRPPVGALLINTQSVGSGPAKLGL